MTQLALGLADTLILRGGTVVDGTGAPPAGRDVVVAGGLIRSLHPRGETEIPGAQVIDCTGWVVAPGFIDIHAHSDLTRLRYPDAATRVLQGVTTEVIGNCGLTPAPVPASDRDAFRAVIGTIDVAPDVEFSWTSTADFLRALDAVPGATNLVPLTGHGSIRYAVMGARAAVASNRELDMMAGLLHDAFDAGCWGMSLGLMYPPGELSDRAELRRLTGIVAGRGALLTAHLRAYDAERLPAAVEEVVSLAARAGTGLEISHLRSLRDPDGSFLERAVTLMEAADDVEADSYPYLAGHTTLLQLLPSQLRGRGIAGIVAVAARHPGEIASAIRQAGSIVPEDITVAKGGPGTAPEVGRTLAELGREANGDWALATEDLIGRYDGNVDVIVVGTRPQDALRALAHPRVSIASDGVSLGLEHAVNLPHPRSIGTFPRAVSELRAAGLRIEEIVGKMTAKPAKRIGLAGRGVIAPGKVADVVVFSPEQMKDNATYTRPLTPPSGVRDVFVSGQPVLLSGTQTGLRPGSVLRRGA
jgi:N-acyl-D-aspartate/D-glutamate deacylase